MSCRYSHVCEDNSIGFPLRSSSCQFATRGGCILICRVVLSRMEVLQDQFPANGYDSSVAKKSHTEAPSGLPQLHNEFIVYDDRACYPEFVISATPRTDLCRWRRLLDADGSQIVYITITHCTTTNPSRRRRSCVLWDCLQFEYCLVLGI